MNFSNRTIGATLLVTGTCIGAGMLGLPVKTAGVDLYTILGVFFLVWAVMSLSALYMLEASLWFSEDTNMISMARIAWGKIGSVIVGVTYIVFLYAIMAAYTSGGSSLLKELIQDLCNTVVSDKMVMIGFVLPFMIIVYLGSKMVDYTNRVLMIGLIVTYFILLAYVIKRPHIHLSSEGTHSHFIYAAIPLIVTSFGFHLLIPSLKTYLSGQVVPLKRAIIIGSMIPFLVYIIWEFSILTTLPLKGSDGLLTMLKEPGNPAELLVRAISQKNASLAHIISGFSLFALVSSFVGVSLGLSDFFADGLKMKKTYINNVLFIGLTFLPPALFSIWYPKGFLLALSYASIFAALLLIIYPALIVWVGRYHLKIAASYRVWGGKITLSIAIVAGLCTILIEIIQRFGKLPLP